MTSAGDDSEARTRAARAVVRRPPAAQAAVLMLAVCGLAALNVYRHPPGAARVFTIALALACLGAAVASLRMFLVADADGVRVRFLLRTNRLPWSEVDRIDVVTGVRGAHTVRFGLRDGPPVDVPPSLLQPGRPTRAPVAMAQLRGLVRELEALRAGR